MHDIIIRTPNALNNHSSWVSIMARLKKHYQPEASFFYISKYNDVIIVNRDNVGAIAVGNASEAPLTAKESSFFVFNFTKTYNIDTILQNVTLNVSFTDQWFFKEFINANKPAWASQFREADGELSTHVAAPIYLNGSGDTPYDGVFFGMIGIDLSLQKIAKQLNNSLKSAPNVIAFILAEQTFDLIAVTGYATPLTPLHPNTARPLVPVKVYNHSDLFVASVGRLWKNDAPEIATARISESVLVLPSGKTFRYQIRPIPDRVGVPWLLVIGVQETYFLTSVAESSGDVIGGSIAILVLGCFVVLLFTVFISMTISSVSREMKNLSKLSIAKSIAPCLACIPLYEIQNMIKSLNALKRGISFFKKYVPVSVVRRIMKQHNELQLMDMQSCECSTMFV